MVKGDKLNDMGRYGVVEKLLIPQTLLIRLRRGGEMERTYLRADLSKYLLTVNSLNLILRSADGHYVLVPC